MTCECCHCKEKPGCATLVLGTLMMWYVMATSTQFWIDRYKDRKQADVPTVIEAPR